MAMALSILYLKIEASDLLRYFVDLNMISNEREEFMQETQHTQQTNRCQCTLINNLKGNYVRFIIIYNYYIVLLSSYNEIVLM